MSADQVRRALAEVCGYHDGPDCQHCADTYAHAQLHKGMSDDEILADIQLYRSDFRTWEAKVRAAGRRQAAEDLFETLRTAGVYAVHTPDGRIYQLVDVAFAVPTAHIAEGAPAEPVEEADRG